MWCPECKKTSAKPFSLGWSSGAPFLGEGSGGSSPSRNSLNQNILNIYKTVYLYIWPSRLFDFWPLANRTSGYLDFFLSGLLVIRSRALRLWSWTSRLLAIWYLRAPQLWKANGTPGEAVPDSFPSWFMIHIKTFQF